MSDEKPEPRIVEGVGRAHMNLSSIFTKAQVKASITEVKLTRRNEQGEVIGQHRAEFPDGNH